MQPRLHYVDSLKGLAIFLVVLGHVLQHYYSDETFVYRFVYSFHMPLFMFMSGYVCYLKNDWNMVKRRAIQLLIPFFSYIFLVYGINIVIGEAKTTFPVYFVDVLLRPDRGLWFLWALFFITVIFIACRRIAHRFDIPEWPVMLVMGGFLNAIVIFGHFRLLGFHWIAWYFLYFYIGVAWRQWSSLKEETSRIDHLVLIVSGVLFVLMVGFFRMHNEPPLFYKWINLGAYFPVAYRFVIGLAGIAAIYETIKLYYRNNLIYSWLCELGG